MDRWIDLIDDLYYWNIAELRSNDTYSGLHANNNNRKVEYKPYNFKQEKDFKRILAYSTIS